MSASRPTPDFDELLSAYVDNELTSQERAVVDERLRTDEQARQTLAELRRASEAVKSLPRVPLGRDLSGSVLAAIARQASASASASEQSAKHKPILTLPQRIETPPRGSRNFMWAALAVAAVLLLMVVRPGVEPRDERRGERSLAKVSAPAGAQQPKAPNQDEQLAVLDRQADVSDIARTAAAPNDPTAGSIVRPSTSATAPAPSASVAERVAESPRLRRDAAAPPATSQDIGRGAASSEIVPSSQHDRALAAAPPAAASAAVLAEAAPGPAPPAQNELRTIELTVSGADGVAQFERLLAANQISLSTADFAGAGALADSDSEQESGAAKSAETNASEKLEANPADAFLVEASPETLAALIAALEPQPDGAYLLPADAESLRDESQIAAGNIAWRLPRGADLAQGAADFDGAATLNAASEPGAEQPVQAPAARAGGFGASDVTRDEPLQIERGGRTRILFLLRPQR